MELIKSNIFFIATSIVLLGFLLVLNRYNPKTLMMTDLIGFWEGQYKNNIINIEINEKNNCLFKFKSLKSSQQYSLNGDCFIDKSKSPYSLIISNIRELNTSLYTIIIFKDVNTFYLSEFSPKWKLRPLSISEENRIIFKKKRLT
jgi:hypothetical protein